MAESLEMYLETLYLLSRQGGPVRAVEIAEYMSLSKPSVSRAVKLLREEGLIDVDGDRSISLTEKGSETARTVYERHTVLSRGLMRLGVDPATAEADACKMEHVISRETFLAIKDCLAKLDEGPFEK